MKFTFSSPCYFPNPYIFGNPIIYLENRIKVLVMYLDGVLGSKKKVNLLSVLIHGPEQGIIEGQLAKRAGVSASEVNRQINDLVTIGLVRFVQVGRSKLYTINQRHFLFSPLSRLYRSLNEVYREIADKITENTSKQFNVNAIILVGSLGAGSMREDYVGDPSDIDLVFVVDDDGQINPLRDEVLNYTSQEIFPVYGVNAYPIVLSKSDYISGLTGDAFIMNTHTNGELMYGEKPRRFG